ncbi:hypothetical protein I7I50_05650 [Histoplasma capsulatum G186AR]|uniref:Uncharacterized protein n=1 Tax=Ajellomyces capsulatus TaxID=5037 RepID=A0A8H8DA72_AJECA|nr:hypothetical protein I7I52_03910 [Histoplasma capsulatum]QSS76259.1 hypothetical protein I7I50_05650 [Histoplasma capsulatum G186AR]
MAFFLAPIQSGHHQHQQQQQQQQQQHPQPAVFQFIPMQNPAHPQHAALQAAHPFPGHVIENHNPAPVPPAAPAIAPAPAPAPVNNAPNQAVMVAVVPPFHSPSAVPDYDYYTSHSNYYYSYYC